MTTHLIVYEGANVSLGAMVPDYVPLFVPWINKRESIVGTLQRGPYTLQMGHDWLQHLGHVRGKDEVFAILKHCGEGEDRTYEYIGHTGIHDIRQVDGFGTTGSMILNPESQRQGLGTEAKLLLLYHAFEVLNLRKVLSDEKTSMQQAWVTF